MKKIFILFFVLFAVGSVMAKSAEDTDTIPVHIVNPGWDNQVGVGETGTWTMTGYSADSMYWVCLANYTPVSHVAGTYTSDDMDMFLCFLYDMQRTGTEMQYYSTLDVQIDSVDNKFVISALYTTYAGMVYSITVDSIPAQTWQNPTSLGHTKSNAINNSRKAIIDGKVILQSDDKRYRLNGQSEK